LTRVKRIACLMVFGLALLGAVPAVAGASCASKIGESARIVEQSRAAVVYRRVETVPGTVFKKPIFYGCEFRAGKLRRLNDRKNALEHHSHWALAGHFVAFAFSVEEGASSETLGSIKLFDLRTGERVRWIAGDVLAPGTDPVGPSQVIYSLVLKPNGSLAWIVSYEPTADEGDDSYQVNKLEAGSDETIGLDDGRTIRKRSLALSQDRRTIYWTNAADTRSARLR
jgi:hypothetical protein